jgi:hypothetical protein
MRKRRNGYKILTEKSEGKRPLRRLSFRLEDTIKMGLREIILEGLDLIHLPQDVERWRAFVKTAMNLRVP